ncbi:hypothetical protein QR680_015660 [Steinernema hermaphroditum]|uniref:G-protein coupled receptors family 1 profile domain-containing protein n=1 Tax=Steinernema hermaphroditum TaxID=289476 RepID=A0AA39H8U8_9BILA|nr:hypothetical protein QR680_015660 [Steinernema hermaphroditum]
MFPGYLVIMLTIYSVVFVVGVVGNVWVILSLVLIWYDNGFPQRSKFKRVLSMLPMLIGYFLKGTWEFGYFACKLFWTIENVNKLLSVGILTVMSFERYLGVCKPFPHSIFRNHNAGIVLVFLVFFVVILCIPIIYFSSTTEHVILTADRRIADTKISCSSDVPDAILPYFILYMFVFAFLFPVVLITFCYVQIVQQINDKTRKSSVRSVSKVSTSSNRVIRSILWVVVFHFVCWTPFWLAILLTLNTTSHITGFLVVSPRTLAIVRLFTSFLPYINSAGNWIFYAAFNRELQDTSREVRQRHARKFQSNVVVGAMLHRAYSIAARPTNDQPRKYSFYHVLDTIKNSSLFTTKIEQERETGDTGESQTSTPAKTKVQRSCSHANNIEMRKHSFFQVVDTIMNGSFSTPIEQEDETKGTEETVVMHSPKDFGVNDIVDEEDENRVIYL